jgi:hypothetical protein
MAKRQLPKKTFTNVSFDALDIIGEEPDARGPQSSREGSRAGAPTEPSVESATTTEEKPPQPLPRSHEQDAAYTPPGRTRSQHEMRMSENPASRPSGRRWEQTSLKIDAELLNRFKNAIYERRLTLYEAVNEAIAAQIEVWEREYGGAYPQRPTEAERLPPGRRMR